MSDTIVIGIDGSERSHDAVALGKLLARAWGASALLVAVHPFEHADWGGPGPVYAAALSNAEAHLAEAARLFGDAGAAETRALGCSSPARGLQALAEQVHASAIVVGSTHRGAIGRVLPGGVGERLLHGAPCPVAIAPRGFADRDDPPRRRIGVAYVSGPDGTRAVQAAASLAGDVGAELVVMSALDPNALQVQLVGGGLGMGGAAAGFDQESYDEVSRVAHDASKPILPTPRHASRAGFPMRPGCWRANRRRRSRRPPRSSTSWSADPAAMGRCGASSSVGCPTG